MGSDDIWETLPVWDTPLHDAIELTHCTLRGGQLVIMHPDDRSEQWLESTAHIDTYDAR